MNSKAVQTGGNRNLPKVASWALPREPKGQPLHDEGGRCLGVTGEAHALG